MRLACVLIAALTATLPSRADAPQASASTPLPAYFKTGTLTFEDRVWAQTQIERVYYNHRIWPKENPQPKPPFDTMVPASVIEAKVTDSLKKSAALDKFWQHPVTSEMLQAELDRMAKQTRDPATLKELFTALNNDPRLIAETLAREALSDRLIRNWYAFDTRFHAEARARSDAAAARSGEVDWKKLGGQYHHQITALETNSNRTQISDSYDVKHVDAEEFSKMQKKILSATSSEMHQARSEETPEHFTLTKILTYNDERIEVASVVFSKESFTRWWGYSSQKIEYDLKFQSGLTRGDKWMLPAVFISGACNDWGFAASLYDSPDGRILHTAIWTGSEMIIWGGEGSTAMGLNTGGRYNPATDSWQPTPVDANTPVGRSHHTTIWTGSVMVVWGGGFSLNTGGRYNPSNNTWLPTSTGANVPVGRINHTAIWTGSQMILWGGYNQPFTNYPNTSGKYNPANDTWQYMATSNTGGRQFHTAIWTGTDMLVWGGTIPEFVNSGERYNPVSDMWTPISAPNYPTGRRNHTAVWTGSEMIIWGGESDSGLQNTGGRYNPSSNTWQPTSTGSNVPNPRYGHTAVWTGSMMIVWGSKISGTGYNEGGRYFPGSDTWLATATGANAPTARELHTAVWTGSEMIVWGGAATPSNRFYNSGARYNPLTDTWLPTFNGANTPSGRSGNGNIWTGVEMVIWGGSNFLNTGGRYNPATDSWQPTSTGTNVPPGNAGGYTMVWTGTEMIEWGGGSNINLGGRYNPTSDTWLPTSVGMNVPSGRTGHSAVWNGSEMIIWGGRSFSTQYDYLNTGGRYDPSSDSWLPISTGLDVPLGRFHHSATWTGTTMLVWGGTDVATNDLNSGGRYNPASDSWAPTSTGGNVPSGRSRHTAIWTGNEMIVWGGGSGSGGAFVNTGGRYNPISDVWQPTSIGVNAPTARNTHTAIWTSSEMIVWGGVGAGYLNTGGRYSPSIDSWLPTPLSLYVPSPRGRHSAVWTGSSMVIWGGFNDGELSSGGFYLAGNPASPGNSMLAGKVGTTGIRLDWPAILGATSYNVKRCPGLCSPVTIVATPSTNSYSEGLAPGSFFYSIEAVNACGATP